MVKTDNLLAEHCISLFPRRIFTLARLIEAGPAQRPVGGSRPYWPPCHDCPRLLTLTVRPGEAQHEAARAHWPPWRRGGDMAAVTRRAAGRQGPSHRLAAGRTAAAELHRAAAACAPRSSAMSRERNLVFDLAIAERVDQLPGLAAGSAYPAARPDVIVASGTPAVLPARNATSSAADRLRRGARSRSGPAW